jgi:hypothetical protein
MSGPTRFRKSRRSARFLGSRFSVAVVASALTVLVVGGAVATAVTHTGSGKQHAATPKAKNAPGVVRRQAAVGQQVWNGFVPFIDPLDPISYIGIGGSPHAATVPGAIGSMVAIAGTLGNFQARLASTPSSGTATFTAYTNAPSTVTCTITPPAVACADAAHTLVLAADKILKIQITNSGSGPLYGARWSATYTPS